MSEPKLPLINVNPPADAMWSIEEACELIRSIQVLAYAHGYCLALGGGVLNNGFSVHDLDIVVVPLTCGNAEVTAMGFLRTFEHTNEYGNYAWSLQAREQQGEVILIRYSDFHSEKVAEFRFVTETDLNLAFENWAE